MGRYPEEVPSFAFKMSLQVTHYQAKLAISMLTLSFSTGQPSLSCGSLHHGMRSRVGIA